MAAVRGFNAAKCSLWYDHVLVGDAMLPGVCLQGALRFVAIERPTPSHHQVLSRFAHPSLYRPHCAERMY